MSNMDWALDLQRSQMNELVQDGFVHVDENGEATLTEKGKNRVANRLDRLPLGDEILIQIAVLAEHEITVTA